MWIQVNSLSQAVLGKKHIPNYQPPAQYTGEMYGVEYLYHQTGAVLVDSIDNIDEQIDEGFCDVEEMGSVENPMSQDPSECLLTFSPATTSSASATTSGASTSSTPALPSSPSSSLPPPGPTSALGPTTSTGAVSRTTDWRRRTNRSMVNSQRKEYSCRTCGKGVSGMHVRCNIFF